MSAHLTPERKQALIFTINAYLEKHYCTHRFAPDEFEDTPSAPSCCDKSSLHLESTAQPTSNWDDLLRIFSKREHSSPPSHTSVFSAPAACAPCVPLHDRIEQSEQIETFSQALIRIVHEKEFTEPEVYNRVFMDRKLFNKIRNTPEYQPSKRTALLLALALKLDLEQTQDFIGKAGFQLVDWNKGDVILKYFIENENYDVFEINEMLAEFKMPLLFRCD